MLRQRANAGGIDEHDGVEVETQRAAEGARLGRLGRQDRTRRNEELAGHLER
jgi:hypothetical protein